MRHVSARAIILKKRNVGEHDQFVTIFCPVLGTVDAVAKGSRKVASSFIGHLELFNICRLELYRTPHRFTITQCQAEQTFKPIRDDLTRSINAFLVTEIFQKIVHSSEQGEELLSLLEFTLAGLASTDKPLFLIENFKIKLLQLCGSLPEVSRCSQCHRKWKTNEEIFIIGEAHMLCGDCRPEGNQATMSFNLMKLVHHLANEPFETSKKLRLTEDEFGLLHTLTNSFLSHSLTAEINTEKMRSQLIRKAAGAQTIT